MNNPASAITIQEPCQIGPTTTIQKALERIQSNDYVLPALQRNYVWRPHQIINLFDSVMKGYPVGAFMFWYIEPERSADYVWYGFVRDYHQKNNSHNPHPGPLDNKPLRAVIDGQQRLSAFNIGLRGSMAVKLPRLWWNNPNAFPKKFLTLDLLKQPEPYDPDERKSGYGFEFVEENRIGRQGDQLRFKVAEVLGMRSEDDLRVWIDRQSIEGEELRIAYGNLNRLFQVVCVEKSIAHFKVDTRDYDRILDIFVRCNRGGTELSYANLVRSLAISQWDEAREEFERLVRDMNGIGDGFNFDDSFLLRAGLMLTDQPNVRFRATNFNRSNIAAIRDNWTKIRQTLLATAELASSFGFNSSNIGSHNYLLPIAYYFYRRDVPQDFTVRDSYRADREVIRNWLTRSLLKRSIWGNGADTLLIILRRVVRDSDGNHFPAAEIQRVMAQRGRSLDFSEEEIETLADMGYGNQRVFPLLTLLFSFVDTHNQFHIDHVFPRSRFTPGRLKDAGVSEEDIEEFRRCSDRLANLQLIDGIVNIEKQATPPADWLDAHCPDDQSRQAYCERHLLGDVPREITGFLEFYKARRERLKQRIAELINAV